MCTFIIWVLIYIADPHYTGETTVWCVGLIQRACLPVEHVLQPISQSMHSPVSGSCTCPETQKPRILNASLLGKDTAHAKTLLYTYLCHTALFGRAHCEVCSVLDIWRICCHLCRVHNWLCRAGRHSDPCQGRIPAGSASDSDLGGGNALVRLHLKKWRRSRRSC